MIKSFFLIIGFLSIYSIIKSVTLLKEDDVNCLALNIYHESRNESTAGQLAVAQVVINRMESRQFPNTICGVVQQGLFKGGFPVRDRCQFSWFCDGISDNPRDSRAFDKSVDLAEWLLFAKQWVPDITDGALFYHASYVDPFWSKYKKKTLTIDNHIFYK